MPQKILFAFGTRPEAIKLCPVIRHMRSRPEDFDVRVCVTAQHREMLDQVLNAFSVAPDHDLDVMRLGQTLCQSTARIIAGLEPVIAAEAPDLVLVQGDTTTTFCGAMAAFYARTSIAHVEAGLRTGDPYQPFPEEMNRVLTSKLVTFHFAPTSQASANLIGEGVDPATITVTGNTGIDAVLQVKAALEAGQLTGLRHFSGNTRKKLIVVTGHRRENFGAGFENICSALLELSRRTDVEIVYPVHPNPNVRLTVNQYLASRPNIFLIDPLDYVPFVDLMRRAYMLLTDSGGVQEEGPSLGKPVLVLRDKTERPEAVAAGTTRLVGTDRDRIVAAVEQLLDDPSTYYSMARQHNPYGDGTASRKIADVLAGANQSGLALQRRLVCCS